MKSIQYKLQYFLFLLCICSIGSKAQSGTFVDVHYGTDSLETLDVFLATGSNRPIVMFIHGGGWKIGDKSDLNSKLFCEILQSTGYTAVNVNYRLSSEADYTGFPMQPKNIACALAWIKTNAAAIHGDSANIVLAGFSSGGHLASLVALWNEDTLLNGCAYNNSLNVKGVVSIAGLYDFSDAPDSSMQTIKDMVVDSINYWELAQPVNHVRRGSDSKFLIMHGTRDDVAGNAQPFIMHNALVREGFCVETSIFKDRTHYEMLPNLYIDTFERDTILNFLNDLFADKLCPSIALPVDWLHFDVQALQANKVSIEWSTAIEINNAGFAVMRSKDAINFEQIAYLYRQSNTNSVQHYSYIDQDIKTAGIYYYKVVQTDLDGHQTETAIQSANIKNGTHLQVSEAFPNPLKNQTQFSIWNVDFENVNMEVKDILGNIVYAQAKAIERGEQLIPIQFEQALGKGIYFISFNFDGQTSVSKKLIIE